MMARPAPTLRFLWISVAAVALAVLWIGWTADGAVLLTKPRPDLALVLFPAGAALGLVAARWLVQRPAFRADARRMVFWILLPLMAGVQCAMTGDRLYEAISFNGIDPTPETVIARVVDKDRSPNRRFGDDHHYAIIASPFAALTTALRVNAATFAQLTPGRDCVALTIQKGRGGAVRMLTAHVQPLRCPAGN
jgi:hypothetical protein